MHRTLNDLPKGVREKLVRLLNTHLACAIDLQTRCKQAHWNVRGPQFISLHKLFDEVNEVVEEFVDELAERIAQLGGVALGTAHEVARATTLERYPTDIAEGPDHCLALAESLAAFGAGVRKAIETSDKMGDAATADLFTELARGCDKSLWFVEAHLQAKR